MGSRDWITDVWEDGQLGEQGGVRPWDAGEPPTVRPELVVIGNADCIANGGSSSDSPLSTSEEAQEMWLPAGCYVNPADTPFLRMQLCPDMATLAAIQAYVWENPAIAQALAITFLGPGTHTQLFVPADGDQFSRSLVAVRGNEAWQWIDGTRNAGQLLAQVYGTSFGPTDYDGYDSTPIYNRYATECLQRFSDAGAGSCTRFGIMGHSYGGATAAVVAVRLKRSDSSRMVALMTEGAPRGGGPDLIEQLDRIPQLHLRRPYDPIPWLPPRVPAWALLFNLPAVPFPITQLTLAPFLRAWGGYENYKSLRTLDGATIRAVEPDDAPSDTDLIGCANAMIRNGVLDNFNAHDAKRYANDMADHCGVTRPFVIP